MKRIAVDMDGVLANVYAQFVVMYAAEFGDLLTPDDYNGKTEGEAFRHAKKFVNSPGFFRNAPLMENSQRVLKALNERYQVFIVSAALEFPNSLQEKQAWLYEHFPFIVWQQVVFCGSKEIIKADIMIDDHFKNLNHFAGETILFTQPHNIFADAGKHTRVEGWTDIERLLLL